MTPFLIEKYGSQIASASVEVQVTNTSGMYFLPDTSILRDCKIIGLIIPDNTADSAVAPQSMRNLVSDAILQTSFITLKDVNNEVYEKHPLSDFQTASQAGDIRLLQLNGFNPQKSFIEIPSTTLAAQANSGNESFLLQFLYISK